MAEYTGVIRLPSAVVAFANDGARQRIADARSRAAGALVKVPRILSEQRRQRDIADHRARDTRRIERRVSFRIAIAAAAEAAEVVARLLNTGDHSGSGEGDGIDDGSPGEVKFLA